MFAKYLLLAVCVAAPGAYLAIPSRDAAQPASGPELVVQQTERSLGTVVAGRPVRAGFTLFNAGGRRLIVREDRCLACGPGEWLIPPGESQDLTIELNTTGLEGEVRQVQHYTTNDPRQPRLTLAVSVNVQPD
jgi:hypothetical protein